MSGDAFEPYAIAAVELADEKMVVLGQVAAGVGIEALKDADNAYMVWNWRPAAA